MARQKMLVMVDARDNNNKFYELTELPDGSVQARYGRIGATEQVRTYAPGTFDRKLNEKLRKGYTIRETAADAVTSPTGVEAAPAMSETTR